VKTNKKVGITFNTNTQDALKRLEKVKKIQPFIEKMAPGAFLDYGVTPNGVYWTAY
jgi:hypothetical protein